MKHKYFILYFVFLCLAITSCEDNNPSLNNSFKVSFDKTEALADGIEQIKIEVTALSTNLSSTVKCTLKIVNSKFPNGNQEIELKFDANNIASTYITSQNPGLSKLDVFIGSDLLESKDLHFISPEFNLLYTTIFDAQPLPADNYSTSKLIIKYVGQSPLPSTTKCQVSTSLGSFQTNATEYSFDSNNVIVLYLKSGSIGTAHVEIKINNLFFKVLDVFFDESFPDLLNIVTLNNYYSVTTTPELKVQVDLTKFNGSIATTQPVNYVATNLNGDTIGYFTNITLASGNPSLSKADYVIPPTDTSFRGDLYIRARTMGNNQVEISDQNIIQVKN